MARAYSVDLRERVVRAVENRASRRAAAAKFEVSTSFVVNLMQRWRRCGTVQPDRIGDAKRSALAAHGWRVRALVAAEPDLTIAELGHRLADACDSTITVETSGMWGHAGTDVVGPAAADRAGGRARQLDPFGRTAFRGQPLGGDQAAAVGADDRQRRACARWRPSPAAAGAA